MLYERIISYVLSTPWALRPEALSEYAALLALRSAGRRLSDDEITARIRAGQERVAARGTGAQVGTVAVMTIIGTMLSRAGALRDVSGAASTQQMAARFQQLVADDNVGAIVLDIDSPGGEVGGVAEFADRVYEARDVKPVVAVANPQTASAAYWIGVAASQLIVTPSGEVGSVGVYAAHEDISKYLEEEGVRITLVSFGEHKVEGNPFEPLSDEARAQIQKRVNEYGELFVRGVARGRGVRDKVVREQFGGGRCFGAVEAVQLGMADNIGTLDDAIALAAKLGKRPNGSRATASTARPIAVAFVAQGVDPAPDGSYPEGYEKRDDGMCHPVEPAAPADAPTDAARAQVEPNPDGTCPDGYDLGEDGRCHLRPEQDGAAASRADLDRRQRRLRLAGVR